MGLVGKMFGHFYEPPENFNECSELINLKEIVHIKLCQVCTDSHYGRHDRRGLLLTTRFGQEYQVNYECEQEAERELQALKHILSKFEC